MNDSGRVFFAHSTKMSKCTRRLPPLYVMGQKCRIRQKCRAVLNCGRAPHGGSLLPLLFPGPLSPLGGSTPSAGVLLFSVFSSLPLYWSLLFSSGLWPSPPAPPPSPGVITSLFKIRSNFKGLDSRGSRLKAVQRK